MSRDCRGGVAVIKWLICEVLAVHRFLQVVKSDDGLTLTCDHCGARRAVR